MSRLFSIAFAMKARIEVQVPALAGAVIVMRQNDVETEFVGKMAKAKGLAVLIRLTGGKNSNRRHTKPNFAGTFTVTLFSSPLLTAKDAAKADDLIEAVWTALHGWWPESIPSNGLVWGDCLSVDFPDAPDYHVSRLTVESPRTSN